MQQSDDVISGWLSGSDSIDGLDNPAGPLYIEGQEATEAALTNPGMRASVLGTMSLVGGTTCSYGGGCLCC
jgi:hypothetical protein